MRIAGSEISIGSSRSFVRKDSAEENLESWVDASPQGAAAARTMLDKVTLSEELKARLERMQARDMKTIKEGASGDGLGPELLIRRLLIEYLSGRKMNIMNLKKLDREDVKRVEGDGHSANGAQPPDKEGWGLVYNARSSRFEEETTVFNANGVIKTSDGQEIRFKMELSMNRQSFSETTVSLRAGDAKKTDPIVINFNGSSAKLEAGRYAFDLDSDGNNEEIPFLSAGSGFLALDLNADGKVNNGKELFGPSSGNGFSELGAYDTDHNSWIDEADPVFERLGVWTKDADGADVLTGLAKTGVGAIYLGYASTDFDSRSPQNDLLGQIRSTSVYIKEDGGLGTVQQIDLVA